MNHAYLAPCALAVCASMLMGGGRTAAAPIAQGSNACTVTGYSKNCGGCRTLAASGSFSIPVPNTRVIVLGRGSSAARGTTICLARIAPPRPSTGGVGLRVTAKGRFVPLHLKKGKLYRFVPRTKKLTHVKVIAHPGLYQAVGF